MYMCHTCVAIRIQTRARTHTQQSKEMMGACGATLLLGDSHTLKELGKGVDPEVHPPFAPLLRGGLCKVCVCSRVI